jgi:hypothetical protein
MTSPRLIASGLLIAGLSLGFGIARAAGPTAGDVAECNQEARDGLRSRAVSPNQKDEAGARQARNAPAGAVERADATGRTIRSTDPQIDGMESAGAREAAYRAAYRVCMRKRGY